MGVTTGMKGDGYYDDHSAPQMATIAAVLPWLEEAVAQLIFLAFFGGPLVVADFACSEGRNSIAPPGGSSRPSGSGTAGPSRQSTATCRPTTSTSCSPTSTPAANRHRPPTSSPPPWAGPCTTSSCPPTP